MEELPDREPNAERPDAFYRASTAELLHLGKRAGLPPARAEDVAQSVWLKYCENNPCFEGEDAGEHEHAWLLNVARHEIANAYRSVLRHPIQPLNAEPVDYRENSAANAVRDEGEQLLLSHGLEELLQRDPLAYELVCQHHKEGISIADLANRVGRDARWISGRIHRALKKLRIWMSNRPEDIAEVS